MALNQTLKALAAKAAELEDQTQVATRGDFERDLPKEGPTVGRFIEYIELGKQPRKPWKGKERAPADMVLVTFELTHPSYVKTVVKEDKTEVKIPSRISVRLNKTFAENGNYKALFNKMRYGRDDITHMAQMLGEAFRIKVVHNKVVGADKKETIYANITDSDGTYTIESPFRIDELSGEKTDLRPLIPEALSPLRLFIWELASQETWDSLFIDGTRTRKLPDGSEEEVSKNWLQELIIGATNFNGSPLELLLSGAEALDVLEEGQEEEAPAEEAKPAPKPTAKPATKPAAKAVAAPAKKTAAPKAAKSAAAADPLAALGLA